MYRCEHNRKHEKSSTTLGRVVLSTAVKTAFSFTIMVCVVHIRAEKNNIKY